MKKKYNLFMPLLISIGIIFPLKAIAGTPVGLEKISVDIRKLTDGSGISNIVAFGGKIVTIDPNDAKIRIYDIGKDAASAPKITKTCNISYRFSPWKTDIINQQLYIYSEPPSDIGTKRHNNISNSSKTFIKYHISDLNNNNCPQIEAADNKPLIGNSTFSISNNSLNIGKYRIKSSDDAEIIAVKEIGALKSGQKVFVAKEIIKSHDHKYYGRINIRIRIIIFGTNGEIISQGELKDFDINSKDANVRGLYKRGFDYLAAYDNYLFLVQSGTNHRFILTKYQLFKERKIPNKFIIGPDALLEQPSEDDVTNIQLTNNQHYLNQAQNNHSKDDFIKWHKLIEARAQKYINAEWTYRNPSPCINHEPRCVVASDESGNLHDASTSSIALIPLKKSGNASNEWALPRYLLGYKYGDKVKSLPYSYAGSDTVESFGTRITTEQSTPIGNIVEKLQRVDFTPDNPQTQIHYPLGIDCSSFVAHMFGTNIRSTGVMSRFGKDEFFPDGPVNTYLTPVSDITQLRPGDIIFRSGHVMIFANTVKVISQSGKQKSIGYVFYEATSRCGKVCKSIYEPDFINGWWIKRPISLKDENGNIINNPYPEPK